MNSPELKMKNPEELKKCIEELQARHGRVTKKRAALGGELKAKKEELGSLIEEIKNAGYDPATIVAERNRTQQELEKMILDYDKALTEVEEGLASYDKPAGKRS